MDFWQKVFDCSNRKFQVIEIKKLRQSPQTNTAEKMKFSIKDFFSKCDQIRRKLRIWSHVLKRSLMKNFIFSTIKT